MKTPATGGYLLAGVEDAESFSEHQRRWGPAPRGDAALIGVLQRSGLRGRGGAAFPVGSKWSAVAERSRGSAVVVVNGAEGEPLSRKDQALMQRRPHMVLDGAFLAAGALGAGRVIFYVGAAHTEAAHSLQRALRERGGPRGLQVEFQRGPARYVAGEETAAVNFIDNRVAKPLAVPPRPYELGVGGRPTLVQNVESLAHVAGIARYGDAWFRSLGEGDADGTLLLTVGGGVARPGVIEVPAGTTVEDAVAQAGGITQPVRAVLLGGYFGAWAPALEARDLRLDPVRLRERGYALGCGVVWVMPVGTEPLRVLAGIMDHLAGESAAQCGPCYFGIQSLAGACRSIAGRQADPRVLDRLLRWSRQVRGRGACKHPDGAVGFLESSLRVFASEFSSACGLRFEAAAA